MAVIRHWFFLSRSIAYEKNIVGFPAMWNVYLRLENDESLLMPICSAVWFLPPLTNSAILSPGLSVCLSLLLTVRISSPVLKNDLFQNFQNLYCLGSQQAQSALNNDSQEMVNEGQSKTILRCVFCTVPQSFPVETTGVAGLIVHLLLDVFPPLLLPHFSTSIIYTSQINSFNPNPHFNVCFWENQNLSSHMYRCRHK